MGQAIAGRGGVGASRAGEISEGTQIDVLGEDNEMWWPACVTRVDKGKNEIVVEDETGYIQKIKLNKKKHQQRLAALGTHTRNARAYAASEDTEVKRGGDSSFQGRNFHVDDSEEISSFNQKMFVIGKQFDILDIYRSNQSGEVVKKWRPAKIVDVEPPNITVKFDGWDEKHNITLNAVKHSSRIKPFRKKTVPMVKARQVDWESQGFYRGQRVMALDRYRSSRTNQVKQKWRKAEILDMKAEANGKTYLVHYSNWSSEYDRWILQTEGRIMSLENYDVLIASEQRKTKQISKDLRITQEKNIRNARNENSRRQVRQGEDIYEDVKDSYVKHAVKGNLEEVEEDEREKVGQIGSKTKYYENNSAEDSPSGRSKPSSSRKIAFAAMPRNVNDGLVGLHNLGNTCFMNSCLQCLFNTLHIAGFFLDGHYRKELNPNSPTRGQFAKAFGSQILEYWSEPDSHASHSPKDLKNVVSRFVSRFSGFAQHDAQEFLRYLLDGLHEDLNRIRMKPKYQEIIDDPNESELSRSETWWRNYCERNDSCIKDIFCGQLRSYVTCKKCKYRSSAYDPFWDLSIPLPKNKRKCTLQDCLKKFNQREELKGSDAYYCTKCKKHRSSTKVMSVQKWPVVLVIHIKRFHKQKKLNTNVSIPREPLDLKQLGLISENATDDTAPIYDLYGVSNHMGSTEGGHYTADCKNAISRVWYNYDDSHVSEGSFDELDGRAAYLLFYCRQDTYGRGRLI